MDTDAAALSYAAEVLRIEGTDRFQATCVSCMRESPLVDGPIDEARASIRKLGWAEAVSGDWQCPICNKRRTTKRKRVEIA